MGLIWNINGKLKIQNNPKLTSVFIWLGRKLILQISGNYLTMSWLLI